ncbi:hypothetical protein [Actinomadura latina]|uniref:Uncharacterized protein n=1 Tax=Actinomadura latina TaxID=163603 RepID=A0A846YW46_9ACTN|nr:hypothetical protein [Actinomadura latina]NKZ02466.1 hypothetical protein [Actinomadura latina]
MKNLLVIPAAIALTLSLSACGDSKDDAGGGSASPSAGTSAPATPSGGGGGGTITGNGGGTATNGGGGGGGGGSLTPAQRESLGKLRACMIKKGYDMPEIDPNNPVMAPKNTNGKSNEQVNKDAAECATQSQGG